MIVSRQENSLEVARKSCLSTSMMNVNVDVVTNADWMNAGGEPDFWQATRRECEKLRQWWTTLWL